MTPRLTGFQCQFLRCVRDGLDPGWHDATSIRLLEAGLIRVPRGAREGGAWQLTPRGRIVADLLGVMPAAHGSGAVLCGACRDRARHPKDRFWPGRNPLLIAWGTPERRCINCELTRRDVNADRGVMVTR